MELIIYHLSEVKTNRQAKEFLKLPALLYAHNDESRWISPLYNDSKSFFNPAKNPIIKENEIKRWLLYDINKHLIGRIAAFYWKENLNTKFPAGYFGFFECSDDEKGAKILFNAAAEWLLSKGIKTMQGPFYLGGPGFFSGNLIRGFFEPVYGVPFSPPYYTDLFLSYGFTDALHQKTYLISLKDSNQWKFIERQAMKVYDDQRYRVETCGPKDSERFSKDFTSIFNKVWTDIPGMAPMTQQRALNRYKLLKPALIKQGIIFLYFEDEPVAFLFTVPEIHKAVKKFKGKFNILNRLRLWYKVKISKKITSLSGLIYGVVPEHQNKGLEAYLMHSLKVFIKESKYHYNKLKINRVGSFMPGFEEVMQQLNGEIYHEYETYQITLDDKIKEKRELEFFPDEQEGLNFTLNKYDEIMKILLISPAGSNFYAKMGATIPPLGIAYIAAVLRENGHFVKLLDLGVEQKMPSKDYFKFFDVVGISADTPSYPEALSIAKIAKSVDKIVVMGGYHVTFLDKEALNTGFVDFIVRGEGEEIFLNLVNTLKEKGDLNQVKGISFMNHGTYQRNPDLPPPVNLDYMPFPARDLLNMNAYKNKMNGMPFTNLITSRGCPFNCYFCSSSKFGGLKWRARGAKSIVDEIEHLYRTYGYKAFSFMDDNFTLKPKRIFEFADELERRGLNDIHWWCFSRVDILVKNEEMVKRMAEVGAYEIFLGLESSNEELLDTYNKHIGNKEQEQAIKLLRKYGIKIHGSYIMGDIKETVPMVKNTIKWAKRVNAKTTQFSILTPYPGTALYHDIEKENRFLHKDWKYYDALHPVIKLDYISPAKLGKLLVKAYRSVYLNPRRIWGRSNTQKNQKTPLKEPSFVEKLNTVSIAVRFMILLWMQASKRYKKNKLTD